MLKLQKRNLQENLTLKQNKRKKELQNKANIHGIGVDLVEVNRFKNILIKHGDKFAQKILTSGEFSEYQKSTNKAQYMAKCWAVKEAFVKALGTGFTGKFTWGNIGYFSPTKRYGVAHPQVRLNGTLMNDNLLEGMKIHLSVSDESKYVTAYVILERQ